jgi:uroporphyrinogen-III decarboxylase
MQFSSSPLVFIPLHKGADRFMSREQFETFYWPSLKKVMLGLVEDGFIPVPFAEGSYNQRLETIADSPKGTCMWHFDQTDMQRATEVLGDVCAIMGNVPASLTTMGTPEQMKEYCRNLLETCGQGGNFVLTNGCQVDEAREDNIQAMIDSAKESGG